MTFAGIVVRGIAVLSLVATPFGQSQTARVTGTVSAGDTGRPMADATVEIRVGEDGSSRLRSVRTDVVGAFEIRDVPIGRPVTIVASAARYLTFGFGQQYSDVPAPPLTLRAGQEREVSIVLPRLGAVSGRVVDPFGDPLPGVAVTAFRETEVQGFRRVVAGGRPIESRPTDDLGQFRVDGLTPGDYYLGVLSGTLNAAPRFNMTNELGGFVPTYYPSAASLDEAQRVRIPLGEQLTGIVIAAVPGPMARVSGRAIDSKGRPLAGALMSISPSNAATSPAIAGRTQAAADGRFTFSNVPGGSYLVQARSLGTTDAFTGEFGWLAVTVAGSDLNDLVVPTAGPSSVSGRVLISGETLESAADLVLIQDRGDLTIAVPPADLAFEPVIPIASRDRLSSIDFERNFKVEGLWGRRLIRVMSPTAWIVERISLHGEDVTDTPIDFVGKTISGLEIVLTRRSASLSGVVTGDDGEPVAARVLVFAADAGTWTPQSRFVRAVLARGNGTFVVIGLPPGDYLTVAIPPRVVAPMSKASLQRLRERATAIALPEGHTRDVVLTLVAR